MNALIIETDPGLTILWRKVLERRGCHVTEASTSDAAEAALVHAGPFDIILSDLTLGASSTLGALDYARIKYPRAVIVLVAGPQLYTRGELHALAPAADWVLRKPVPIGDLEAVLDYLHRAPAAEPDYRQRAAG